MNRVLALLLLATPFSVFSAPAPGSNAAEREALLSVVRPVAERMAGQPVKFRIDTFNLDEQWALVSGTLVRPDGGSLDWSLARKSLDCDTSDDKALGVVAHKLDGQWTVKRIDVCDSEPIYWEVASVEKTGLPCDLLRGLQGDHELPPLDECRALRRAKRR